MKKILFLCLLVSSGVWADDSELSLAEKIAKLRQENSKLSLDEQEAQYIKLLDEEVAKATDPVEIEKNSKKMWAEHHARFSKPTVQIGMTEDQVIKNTSWGEPEDKNYTTTKHGTREQWVYKNLGYLYFENGKVVAIQSF